MRLQPVRTTCLIALINLLAAAMLVGFGPPKMVDRETAATIRLTPNELQKWHQAAQPPTVTAEALLVYDVDADRTIYSRNAEAPLPPASLTKLMTALLVLESGRMEEVVTVRSSDLIGGATMGLEDGEQLSVEELLWGLLVASGNDAAMTLSRHLGGDVESFVSAMNTRAQEMGFAATHFANPHGFDAEGHTSSANDMLTLTLQLLTYPLFREIVATDETEIAGHRLTNTNEMLDLVPGVDGVKTGTTLQAGQCLVLSVTEEGHRLIVIVMGSDDRYSDATSLHDLYHSNYEWIAGDSADLSVLNRLYDSGGDQVPLRADGDPVLMLRHRWGDPDLVGYRDVTGAISNGFSSVLPVGMVEWRAGDAMQAQHDLVVR